MKSKVVCFAATVIVIFITVFMAVKTALSDIKIYDPDEAVKKKELTEVEDYSGREPVELTESGILAFSDTVSKYITSLANTGTTDENGAYIVENLGRVSEYFAGGEISDKNVSEYFAVLANAVDLIQKGFSSDAEFSSSVSASLRKLDSARVKAEKSENAEFLPAVDTAPNGAFVLSALALNEKSKNTDNTFTITVAGSVLFGDSLDTPEENKFATFVDNSEYKYPLYKLSPVFINDGATFTTLTNPLTKETNSGSLNPIKGDPSFTSLFVGVDGVSLASESLRTHKDAGYNDTVNAFEKADISYAVQYGAATISGKVAKISYIAMDFTSTDVDDAQNEKNKSSVVAAVQKEKSNGADVVVVMIKWNTRKRTSDAFGADYAGKDVSEYEMHFDAYNKNIGRAAIDAGADIVVGSGTHVLQGIEEYSGKLIVYNTGDLVCPTGFEKNDNTSYSFAISETFSKGNNGLEMVSYKILPIVNTSEEAPYLPTIVFDDRADEIVSNIINQSAYFGNPITSFNYIKIEK